MNSVPTKPLMEPQENAVAPPFKVTILYECVDTGKHAKRFSDQLMVAAELEQPPDLDLWNFRVLEMRETRNAAASAAAVADMVVFAMSGSRSLPPSVERWIEMWTWLMDGSKPAVVALFSAPHAERACIQTYLRRVAASKGLGFFPQTIGYRKTRVAEMRPPPRAAAPLMGLGQCTIRFQDGCNEASEDLF